MSHVIHSLSFGVHYPNRVNPLDGATAILRNGSGVFQYFVKVVPTTYTSSGGRTVETNQYSVTQHIRSLTRQSLLQGMMPGVFFIYDLSPISVNIREEGRGFVHFITSLLAIVGGVITLASMLDSCLYRVGKRLQRTAMLGETRK